MKLFSGGKGKLHVTEIISGGKSTEKGMAC